MEGRPLVTLEGWVFIILAAAFTFVTVALCAVKAQVWWSDVRERRDIRKLHDRVIR
jgi:hypothetical protein